MEHIHLGRTGLVVSRLGLGTMNFGSHTSEPDSHAIMDGALDLGINFFDTADIYGRKSGPGGTEALIGRWFGLGGGRRDKVVLATKVYGKTSGWPNDRGLSARHIIKACDASLSRLGTDWIDVYQMHHVDRSTPWDEIWEAMGTLVAQGKVRYVGSCNFAGWHLSAAQAVARERHLLGLVSEQCLYNLFARYAELEVIPAASALGLGVLPWSPLHGGLLSGVLRRQAARSTVRSTSARVADDFRRGSRAIAEYEKFCAELGQDPSVVALAWLLGRPGVTAPIIGPRTVEHLTASMAALTVELDDAVLARLDELFPPLGKGGPAPEAWAW
ncbi:aldo/keto reductase [Streptomyces malaysiensis subsp. malaysiensis]|uniref:aldo/keto reductase n=1 Tax=Streptomyces malaysiensis TaxID=92644 RepID=UPI000BFDC0C5|nr:aldo/keto reductase [Streptomyces malaysiensis]QDL69627.1 aldo/keto reductase [Streptomyces malaysiensis]